MRITVRPTVGILLLFVSRLSAATLYVSTGSVNPTPPYATWATAAAKIQDAADAAASADTVLVTNGVYSIGGRAVGTGLLTNRVAISKAIQLVSVNGPDVTTIQGYQVPDTTTGDGAIRCVYLASGAVLSGFTLTNGATRNAGDFNTDQSGGGVWCESASAIITNCVLVANSAAGSGGGAYSGAFNNCWIRGNSATSGGGAFTATLSNCLIVSNSVSYSGGGANSCTLNNCTVALNSSSFGQGGGIVFCGTTNCIIYYNSAAQGANYFDSCIGCVGPTFSCTTPLPFFGSAGSITNEPLFVNLRGGDFHLQPASPCINAGNNAYAAGSSDPDGNPRISGGVVDMGAYEFQFSGAPVIAVQPVNQMAIPGSNVTFTVLARGAVPLAYQWQFNGTAIPAATDSSLTLTAATTNQAGLYSVIVNNALGSVPSAAAHLTFWPDGIAYVWQNSPSPTPPYTSWATAAHAIQDAVDAAIPGLVVLVTNGAYATGGRLAGGALTNRIVLDKPITLRSVNGPQFTVIEGFQVPGTVDDTGAVRCIYLTDGATVSGFTLTNGATSRTGLIDDQIAGGAWCQSTNTTLTNCVLAGNSASAQGGGVYRGTLADCALIGNRARGDNGSGGSDGGGALMATLIRCTLAGNSAEGQFGWGGGANGSSLFECAVTNNSATYSGGGAYSCTLYNCALVGNFCAYGGGATSSQLYNCTLTGNSAGGAGGVNACSLVNCIVYYNTSADANVNYESRSTFRNCCATPLPAGSGNISLEPQLATTSHLSANSPCRGAGLPGGAAGTDIDGEPWANPPSIGCDEYHAGAVTGPLTVAVAAAVTNVAAGSSVPFTAIIDGRASASVWDFGDGVIVSNRPYASHAWTVPGNYVVVLRTYNDTQPAGVSATVAMHVPGQATRYVAAVSTNPAPPFTSWATAATNIQDAVDAATAGDEILVADGVYASGGRAVGTNVLANRVAVTKSLALRSVNGAQFTFIQGAKAPGGDNGDGAVRCVYLADGASLFGFTLTNGATLTAGDLNAAQAGGGVWSESAGATISNCVVVANSGMFGGGAYRGTLYNCVLSSNSISGNFNGGGGAYQSILYNCTLVGNSASSSAGGGVFGATLYNCIVYYNTQSFLSNYWASTLSYCCTTPMPTNGVGNITNAPLFVGLPAGNFRLQAGSPCINAGNDSFAAGTSDFDGNPRISGGIVDMGAYEFQSSGPPRITQQPLSQSLYAGSNVTFTAGAAGSLPLSWQWEFNGSAILAATNSSLTLAPVKSSQAGGYSVVITNSLGSITSQVAVLTVKDAAPAITSQPVSETVIAGTDITFSVGALGSLPLSWQWNFNGIALRDATNSTLSLAAVTTNQAGVYFVVITNSLGSITSQLAVLTVLPGPPPSITLQPLSQTVSAGSSVTFAADAIGLLPLSWQWLFKGTAIPNATNSSLTLLAVRADQAGVYSVVVSNVVGSATSADATLVVKRPSTGYVWQNSPSPTIPYSSWATAAHTIQDAVDAAVSGDTVLVTNGVYATGGRAVVGTSTNRVVLDKPLTVLSVNGPAVTVIAGMAAPGGGLGDGAIRCIYVGSNAVLSGFTLTNGNTRVDGQYLSEQLGGGAWCEESAMVTNCILIGNSALGGGGASGGTLNNCIFTNNSAATDFTFGGGGAYRAILNNCMLISNTASGGGGASGGTLNNCTLVGNSAILGGGAFDGVLNNCIVYYNTPLNYWACTLFNSCTTPLPPGGSGNIINEPQFVSLVDGDLRLQAGSPCINAGNNAFVSGSIDLDGNPRMVGATVDIGAYEYPSPTSAISSAWLQYYGLPTDGSADLIDTDGDGMNNWQEWICGTNPTNALSALLLLTAIPTGTNVTVSWQSIAGVNYFLERGAEPDSPFVLMPTNMVIVATNIIGQAGSTAYVDTNATTVTPFFYRVGVKSP